MRLLALALAVVASTAFADAAQTLERARKQFADVEYARVIPLAEAVLADPYATADQRIEAHLLCGSALAIVRDAAEAERHFRLLMRLKPDFDMPAKTAPKILAPFRKVQVEERALAAQLAADQRARIMAGLKLSGELPARAEGGRPVPFVLSLKDPTGSVETMRLEYRRRSEGAYSSLALEHLPDGRWSATLPAELTVSETGLTFELYVEGSDAKGWLVRDASAEKPHVLEVSAGQLAGPRKPLPRALFGVSLGATVLSALSFAGFGAATLITNSQYRAMSMPGVDGALLAQKAALGNGFATAANVALVCTAVFLIATVVLLPFIDWHPEE